MAYVVSGTPKVSNSYDGAFAERGKQSRDSVTALNDRMRSDRQRANRSNGQRIRQARERLYGKQSHLVTVTYLPGREPRA